MLLKGKNSPINKNIKGIIRLLSFKNEDEKYFLKKDLNVIKAKIKIITEKPIIPVSVRISK